MLRTSSLTFEYSKNARVLRVLDHDRLASTVSLYNLATGHVVSLRSYGRYSPTLQIFVSARFVVFLGRSRLHFAIIILFHFGKNSALFF